MRNNIERIVFTVILVFSMILMVLINIKLNNIYILQKSRTLNSWLYIEKDNLSKEWKWKQINKILNILILLNVKIFYNERWRYMICQLYNTYLSENNLKKYKNVHRIYIYTREYTCVIVNCTVNCTCIAVPVYNIYVYLCVISMYKAKNNISM